MPMTSAEQMEMYKREGWAPANWEHLPPEITAEFQRMGWRPLYRGCWHNCRRFVLRTQLKGITYVEGWARYVSPVDHAWLIYRGEVLDLTWDPDNEHGITPIYGKHYVVPKAEIRRRGISRGVYEAVRPQQLYSMQMTKAGFASVGLPFTREAV